LPDVFVSYSRDDQTVARRFAEGLEREGLGVWWDQSLSPGEAFDQVTERALDEAKAVIVLWSKASVNSRWVRAEATQANANNRLLPVMIEACRRPIMFELTHTVDLSQWDGNTDDPAWQSFVASVRRFAHRPASAETAAPASVASRTTNASPPVTVPLTLKAPVANPVQATYASTPASAPPGLPRRKALLYGASALGLTAAGFAGGAMFAGRRGEDEAPIRVPSFQRLTFRRGLIRSARLGPDNQTIFYGALWDGELCRANSTRTDNPESRALDLPNANVLAVSRNGDLAISLGPNLDGTFTYGTLARVPIAGGAPRELTESAKFADWSPDGSELAVIRRVDDSDRLEYPLGKVLLQPSVSEGTGLGFVRISPDGRQLAFIHYLSPQSLVGKVCVLDTAGRVTVLTQEYVNVHGLAWHGEEIWYSASDDRPLFRSIMAVKPGSEPRIVARMPVNVTLWDSAADGRLLLSQTDDRSTVLGRQSDAAYERDLSWLDASWVADLSRDGKLLLFVETGQGVGSKPAAYLRGMDGSPAVRLSSGQPVALSPDTRHALIMNVDQVLGRSGTSIDIVPTGAGESRRLPGEGWNYSSARWLPDGKRILLRAAEKDRRMRLYRIELPDGQPQPVTPEGIGSWAVSPDGSTIAALDPEGVFRLYPVDGGATRAVPGATGRERLLGWIDAGLLVVRLEDPASPRGEVHVLDPVTGRQRSWANILPRDSAGIMSMGSFATTPDGRTYVFSWHRALSNLYIADGLV
jgi:eukaryotic-like serine/threonine-protein kinase